MTGDLLLVLGAALASGVEMVEATTIVLALGMSRGWRAPLLGAGAALGVLAVATVGARPRARAHPDRLAPARRRHARAAVRAPVAAQGDPSRGRRAAEARRGGDVRAGGRAGARDRAGERALDGYSFTLAFKSVLLEGLEVVFIVLTLGANQGSIPLAAAGAAVAVVVVGVAAVFVRHRSAVCPRTRSSSASASC